jgi:catechol 2,3-dioxygenase-like lactoylglutathione lyase family enzyme
VAGDLTLRSFGRTTLAAHLHDRPEQGVLMRVLAQFISATPVLASLDIRRSVDFMVSKLGFSEAYAEQGKYGITDNGPVSIHFWACTEPSIAKATSCRVQVINIKELHQHCHEQGIVHPNAPLKTTPWGDREFAVLDPDGNLITFHEAVAV